MKTKRLQPGFTLIELLVAMSITVVLLGILVYMTGISMDTYKKSRNEVRASRQAKEALEIIASDFESMISRRDGNTYEWLYAGEEPRGLQGPSGKTVTNASQIIFFTGATDRYNGDIGSAQDKGGDVSAVCYRLVYRDQIGDTDADQFAVFSLYRHLVNPDETFGVGGASGLLAVNDLKAAYQTGFEAGDLVASNFLVENIYELTVTFLVEYIDSGATRIERVTMCKDAGNAYTEFRLKGDKMVTLPANTNIENGNLIGVEVSITVLTDHGVTLAKKSGIKQADLINQHSYHYTKTINIPRP